jgi:hypothetical protein
MGARRHAASGKVDLEGKATNHIARPGTNSLTATWAVQMDGSDQITGSVGDGVNWTADLLGDRATFSSTNPPSQAGQYTSVLLGNPGSSLAPGGDSYGTLKVDTRGGVTLKASLADRSSLSVKAPLSKNGHWPLYSALYGGKGAILGWVNFADQTGTDLDATLSWIKPAITTSRYYPAGFNTAAALLGSRYVRPTNDAVLNFSAGVLSLDGGNLPAPLTNNIALDTSSKVTGLGPDALTMSFSLSQGLFTGRITPVGATKAIPFKGVVLQKSAYASGHFLGTNESGHVLLQADGGN